MTSNPRVPKAEITAVYGAVLKKISKRRPRRCARSRTAPRSMLQIHGADRAGTLLGSLAQLPGDFTATPMWLNGAPAARLDLDGEINTVVSLVIEGGRITRIYAVRDPHKLVRLDEEAQLTR